MIFLIAFLSLIGLIILHEFGHFLLAKYFGVRVEEFGIFLPPRLFGKKIGETLYSLNLLPFGAFVKLYGEEKNIKDSRSFSGKPLWQRALIILGGVVSFWIVSVVLLSLVMTLGVPTAISDEENGDLLDPKVLIVSVAPDSPAEKALLKPGDIIKECKVEGRNYKIEKVKEVQELTEKYKGKEIILTIQREKEVLEVSLTPRLSPPSGQGPIGITLARITIRSYSGPKAFLQGLKSTGHLTVAIVQGWREALTKAIKGEPSGLQIMGPVGIFSLFAQVGKLGIVYLLQFIATISIYLALFNILPIPALDGGKLVFLGIEAVRRKPVSQRVEQQITSFFFILLVVLIILTTIKDIMRLF